MDMQLITWKKEGQLGKTNSELGFHDDDNDDEDLHL